jgi:hypothetical protein
LFGNRCLHALVAAANCGEFGSTPELGVISMFALCPWKTGSGKFGSPWVRMHWAKARALLRGLTLLPLDTACGAVAVVVVPRLATPGWEDPPPQPAATTQTPRSAPTSPIR